MKLHPGKKLVLHKETLRALKVKTALKTGSPKTPQTAATCPPGC